MQVAALSSLDLLVTVGLADCVGTARSDICIEPLLFWDPGVKAQLNSKDPIPVHQPRSFLLLELQALPLRIPKHVSVFLIMPREQKR